MKLKIRVLLFFYFLFMALLSVLWPGPGMDLLARTRRAAEERERKARGQIYEGGL